MKWISVKDSMPTLNGGQFLIHDIGDLYRETQIEYWFTDIGWSGQHKNITHWMPLPLPPVVSDKEIS